MLRTGDLNLSQFGDPVKDAMKRTMLQHEIVFKNQVRELHRLYWTQKNLMRELYRRELEANERRQTVPPQSLMGREGNVISSEEIKGRCVDVSDNKHRSLNLGLPSAVYTLNSVRNSIGDKRVMGSDMFRPRCSTKGAVVDEGKSLYCYEVIDLEDPVEIASQAETRVISFSGFKVPTDNCGVMGNLQSDVASDMASTSRVQNECGFAPYSPRKTSGFVPDLNHSDMDCSERWPEHKADQSGAGGSESSVAGLVDPSTDSTHKQEPNTSKPVLIDLNIPQDDESSHALNDPMLTFSSPSSSSSVIQNELLWRDPGDRYAKETSAAVISEAPFSVSGGKGVDWLFSGCRNSQKSIVSDFGIEEGHETVNKVQGSNSTGVTECCRNSLERLSSCSNGELPNDAKGAGLSSRDFSAPSKEDENFFPGRLRARIQIDTRQTPAVLANDIMDDKQANHERSEEDTVSSHAIAREHDGVDEKLPSGSKSDAPPQSTECTSLEKLEHENSGTTQSECQIVESLQEKSCNTEQRHDQDYAIFNAADILAGISLARSSPVREQLASVTEGDDEGDQPQYSTDSFEAMILEAPEVRSDEHLTPARQIEGTGGEAGSSGANKLRRGRGRVVRDFQKDILPGMVSLSRHEICEDMHSIGYELRKNGSRRAGGGNWFVPVRCRRSRRYPVGRRN